MAGKQSASGTNLTAQFERYASLAGARVSLVSSAAAAAELIAREVDDTIKCTAALQERYPDLAQALALLGRAPLVAEDLAAQGPEPAALAARLAGGAGLVPARAGVAETGSLLLADDALAPRLLSMLVDICFVLLPAAAILPDLDAVGALMDKLNKEGRRYLSLVTGPSRTADIERVLTIGVQGPRVLHVIILGEEGRQSEGRMKNEE